MGLKVRSPNEASLQKLRAAVVNPRSMPPVFAGLTPRLRAGPWSFYILGSEYC